MSAPARVDKNWYQKGIEAYSIEAILGTLGHYGVKVDEASYRARAKDEFPLEIAQQWHENWSGTGQFSHFPAAASEELWRRWCAPEIAPTDVTLAIVKLLTSLNTALDGKPNDGTWDARYSVVEAYIAKLPPPSDRREKFMAEMVAALGEWFEIFDGMAEALTKKNHIELAERFVVLEEALFPVRAGIATALMRAAKGEKTEAITALLTIARDSARDDFARLSAIDSLISLGQYDEVVTALMPLLDKAQATRDVDLASSCVEVANELLRANPAMKSRKDLRDRIETLATALGDSDADS